MSVYHAEIWVGKYYNLDDFWDDKRLGVFYPKDFGKMYSEIKTLLARFIKQAGIPEQYITQRRMVLKVSHTFGNLYYLICKADINEDGIQTQLKGVYRYHNKAIPVIGQSVLDDKFILKTGVKTPKAIDMV